MKTHVLLLCLALISPWLVRAGEPRDFFCTQATTLSMLTPDSVPRDGNLLSLRNLSWSAEFSAYVLVPVLEFDLSSVPKTAGIESAVLKLSFFGRGSSPMRPAIWIYPITSEWSAKSATWKDRPVWDENFADVEAPPQENDDSAFWEMDITPLVRKWVGGDMENHGLAIVADPVRGDFHNFTFYGTLAGNDLSPVLTITFDRNTQ